MRMTDPEYPLADPFDWFGRWMNDAKQHGMSNPNAMTLATVDADGQPAARTVLLKGFDRDGFVFFTNTTSRKGQALAHEPRCALLFYWRPLDRQVRVRGTATLVTDEEA